MVNIHGVILGASRGSSGWQTKRMFIAIAMATILDSRLRRE